VTLKKLYNEGKISPFKYFIVNKQADHQTFIDRLNDIRKYKSAGKLLDVGCSVGTFLNVARENGWDVYGIDINAVAVRHCKNVLGLKVKNTSLRPGIFPDNFFDVVIMSDLIEHVSDPIKVLTFSEKILKKGGILYIVTPNIDSLVAKLTRWRWQGIKPNEHLYYFSPRTMKKALNKAGFSIVEYHSIHRVRNLKTIVYKSSEYSKTLSSILKLLIPDSFSKDKYITFKLGDETCYIAKK
jgi:2-polyprenyl-3-methyl-5-hydroxy-6-metoxy-1,4-benzoquinol methylase